MRKIFAFLVLTVMCHLGSFSQKAEEPLYIVKNGKLEQGVEVINRENNLIMEQGEGFLSFKKSLPRNQRIYFKLAAKKTYDIKNMNLVVEYQLPETAICDEYHKTNLMYNRCAEKMAPTMTFCAYSPHKYLCSNLHIDGKFDEKSSKNFVTYNSFAYVQDSTVVNLFELDYMDRWEPKNGDTITKPDPLKIKNIYYVKSVKEKVPFFCSKFDGVNTWDETWRADKYYQTGAVLSCNNRRHPKSFKMLYMNQPDNWTCSDGSGYLASELLYGLLIRSAYNYRHKWITDKDTISINNIVLPKGARKINLECLLRAEKLKKDTAAEPIPMYVAFDGGKTFVKVFDDTIPAIYTRFERDIEVPVGAKTMSLYFMQAPTASYVVDNLIISSLKSIQPNTKKTSSVKAVKK